MKELTFSNSRIQSYLNCPAQYYWKYIRNFVPSTKSDALKYGEIIHSMFSTFFDTFMETQSEELSYEKAKSNLIEQYCLSNIDHQVKTVETGLIFLKDVIEFGLHLRGETKTEIKLEKLLFKTGEVEVSFNGTIDLMVIPKVKEKPVEIYDFKTISRFSGDYYIKNELNRQFIGYSWLAGCNSLSLIPLHCIKKPTAFAPFGYDYTKEELELWFIETISIIQSMLGRNQGNVEVINTNIEYPRSCTVCTGVFSCDYTKLCKQGRLDTAVVGDEFMESKERI